MNASSQKRLSKVHPLLSERVTELARNLSAKGIQVEIVQGLRTFAEQDALYAQGRTKPGQRVTNARGGSSNHNYGLAVDVCPFKNGKPDWDDWAGFGAIGVEARKLELEWGGDWKKLVDKPHVQLPSPSIEDCQRLFKKGGLEMVWKSVKGTSPKPEPNPDEDIFAPGADAVAPLAVTTSAMNLGGTGVSDFLSEPQPPATAGGWSEPIHGTLEQTAEPKTIAPVTIEKENPTPPAEQTKAPGIRGSIIGAATFIATTGSGLIAAVGGWPIALIIALFASSAVAGCIWLIVRYWYANRDAQRKADEREKEAVRAHEITVLKMKSAMNPDIPTVKVTHVPTEAAK